VYGRINIPDEIALNAPLIAALVLLCTIVVATGRPEWSLGVFLALPAWTRPAVIGGFAAFYLLIAATLLGAVIYMARRRVIAPVPAHDRWVMLWMGFWWFWTALLILLFRSEGYMDRLVVPLILYIIFPMPFFIIFGDDPRRISGFATAYGVTAVLGGWLTLQIMNITVGDLLADPMLEGLGIAHFGLINYHYFAYGMALTVIFSVVIFLQTRNLFIRLALLLLAAAAGYFLFQAGSRQSLGALAVVLGLLLVWGLRQGRGTRVSVLFVVVPLALVGLYIFQTAPHLIIRDNEQSLRDAFDIVGSRGNLWEIAFGYFLQSPVWGHGYLYSIWAHNIFIGALVDQGFVGMIFLIGFLVFLMRRSFGVGATETEPAQQIWRMGLTGVVLFGLIHAQASGGVLSLWYLYWAAALLWSLSRASLSLALAAEVERRRSLIFPLRPTPPIARPGSG